MYLCYGGCSERVGVKLCKALAQWFTQRTLNALDGLFGRKGRDLVLQQSEFVSDVMGQQISACRQQLPEFDKNWAEILERTSEPLASRRGGWDRQDRKYPK